MKNIDSFHDFLERFEKLSEIKKQYLMASIYGAFEAFNRLNLLEKKLKELEDKK